MKKYWRTIVISLVIVATISTYYIQGAMSSKNDVTFKFKTTSGNKEEIENLVLQASYKNGDIYHPLYISKDGSTNPRSRFIIEDLIADPVPMEFEKYIQDYRKFMRGKVFDPSNYFEDDARLIYTDFSVKNRQVLTLQIDILDKQTNDSTSFEITTPTQANISWIQVNDVFVKNGEIKILVTSYLYNDEEELHVYTVNENKKELEVDSIIAKSEPGMSSIRIYNDSNKIQNEDYYLYKVDKYKNKSEDAESEIISSQAYLHNNLNNEVEEIDIADKLKSAMNSMILHGGEVFIPVHSANGLELNRYNIKKKQWGEPLHFNYPTKANNEEEPFLQLTGSKLYLVNRISDGYSLFIGDFRTGKSLYEGKIIDENRENLNKDYSLTIDQIYSIY